MPFPGTILANYQVDKINRRQVRNAYICIKMHIYIFRPRSLAGASGANAAEG